jgi:hypothetical protein
MTVSTPMPAIYRVIVEDTQPGGGSESFAVLPPNLGPALKAEFPEVRQTARHLYVGQQIVANGEKRFYEKMFLWSIPNFCRYFLFPCVGARSKTLCPIPMPSY